MRICATMMAALVVCAGCRDRSDRQVAADSTAAAALADAMAVDDSALTREALERGRLDSEWTEVVTLDTTGAGVAVNNPEKWEQITPQEVNRGPLILPLTGDVAGPSVLRVQILLDRAFFSPGMMDGRWGKNTAKAVYFFQQREGLRTTGRVDSATFQRLAQVAGAPDALVTPHRLSAADVAGPFVELPDSIYDLARMECTCYESLTEKLSEQFHLTPELLELLNPGAHLDALAAGQTLNVPNVRDSTAHAEGTIASLAVSGRGSYVQALDGGGRILYHFPSTLGATYDPSPQGNFRVLHVARDPWWHFQPALLERIPDDRPDARIPPGPNNRVGVVWMALSAPHYGIHGTNTPETIGYASSAGCVRLTNWDARRLAAVIHPGTPVRFRDIRGRTRSGAEVGARAPGMTTPDPRATASRRDTPRTRATRARETTRDRPQAADTVRPLRRQGSRETRGDSTR